MTEREFEIGTRKFKLSKIDAFKQFHIVRRLGPVLGDLIISMQGMSKLKTLEASEAEKLDQIAKLVAPIMSGISKLSDEDANKVLLGLCSAVEVQQQPIGNWARVSNDAGLLMQDLELPVLLQIAGRAFAYNLAGFFAIAPQVSHGGA